MDELERVGAIHLRGGGVVFVKDSVEQVREKMKAAGSAFLNLTNADDDSLLLLNPADIMLVMSKEKVSSAKPRILIPGMAWRKPS